MIISIPEFLETNLHLDTSQWPVWAQTAWPGFAKWGVVLLSVLAIWYLSKLFGRIAKGMAVRGQRRRAARTDAPGPDESTGELTGSVVHLFGLVLMSPIPLGLAGYDWETLIQTRGPGAFAAVAIMFVAVMVANGVAKGMRSFGDKAHRHGAADDTLFAFAASFVKYLIFAVAILLALTQIGFPSASLAALLGASALAIGLALQDTLKAVAAGIMLALFRPFRIGDFVTVAGLDGEIADISPFITTIRQIDNKLVSVTNDKVWGDPLINHTRQTQRRIDLTFDISYDDDMDKAMAVLMDIVTKHPKAVRLPDAWVGVHALADWSVQLRVRVWVATPDFLQTKYDITKSVKESFDREGISIPYPHQVEIQYAGKAKTGPADGGSYLSASPGEQGDG